MQKRKQQSTVWSPYLLLVSLVDAIRADAIPVNVILASPCLLDFFHVKEKKRCEMQKLKQQSTVESPYLVNAIHAYPCLPDFFNAKEQKRVRDAKAQKTIITVYEYR